MRLGTTQDDLALADAVARFATAELAPRAAEIDALSLSATCHRPKLAELGLTGMNLPEQWGGPGVSAVALLLALVEVSRACASTASMLGAHYLGTDSVLIGGNDEQRARYLPRAASGEWLAGFALTEPRGGSDPADLTTRAVREGDHYQLKGVKHFISNAGEADFLVVYAKTDASAGARGISAFIVDTDMPGVVIGKPEKTMGIRGGHAFEVALDCRVPVARRLGDEGKGFRIAMQVLDNGRVDVAATALGIAEAALAATVAWVRERQVGGEPLATKQGVQWMVADMKTRLEAAWALTMQAVVLREAGQRFTQQASIAKLYASEMVAFVTDAALQLHGGYGFTSELPLERYARDARILRIYEGSSEIQRTIIGRGVLG
jgi:alkylation response protein AidB-like acyl-CoA dehydrogenase